MKEDTPDGLRREISELIEQSRWLLENKEKLSPEETLLHLEANRARLERSIEIHKYIHGSGGTV